MNDKLKGRMISNGAERGLHMELIDEYFETAMEAWDMMFKSLLVMKGRMAERFERYFYKLLFSIEEMVEDSSAKTNNDRGGRGAAEDTKVDRRIRHPSTQFSYRNRGYIGWVIDTVRFD